MLKVLVAASLLAVAAARAESCQGTVLVRICTPKGMETRQVSLSRTGADTAHFTFRRADLPPDAKWMDVVPVFMSAPRGADGYWIQGRGLYGTFDKPDGTNVWWRQQMPIYGMKRGNRLAWAHMRTYRFDYDLVVSAADGTFEIFPRIRFDRVRRFFDLYADIEIDFHFLEGDDADYNGMAKGYQAWQFAHGVKPIKERIKEFPDLAYMCNAMVIRIQTHGAKTIPDKPTDFTKETEWPINVYMPFDKAAEFVSAIRASGIDKAAIVSAGWNKGGYDGQLPEHFPVEPVFGGEAGLRRLIRRTQDLGYLIMLHATCTEVYKICPRFDENDIAKRRDGSWDWNGLYFGGSCYWVCERRSWENWIPDEMRRMRALGVKGSHYVDVFSATYPNRCADPRHPATPEQMAVCQNNILAEAKKVFGGCTSEGGYDHVAANIDCINYVSVEMKRLHDGKTKGLELVSGCHPLWELVYHGVILYTPDRLTQNHTRGPNHPKKDESGTLDWLEGDGIVDPAISLKIVEFGGRPIFYSYKPKDIPAMKRAWDEFVPVRHLQKELMLSHKTIVPGVTVTCYGNGESVVCNYSEKPYTYRNMSVPPAGYRIVAAGTLPK